MEQKKIRNTKKPYYIHEIADVKTLKIGAGTNIWQYCVVLKDAKIGDNVNICSHCFLENDVEIGDRVTVKNGISIYDGIRIEDDVFLGPGVIFTNDKNPRSKDYTSPKRKTIIKKSASIGAGAVILPGLTIGENAIIGAGAIITKDIPANAVVYGRAAEVQNYIKPGT